MRVAVIGAAGQLGSDLVEAFGAVPLTHGEVDVTDPDSMDVLSEIETEAVINAAAYVRVDDAEVEADEAFQVNAVGALNVAKACDEIGAVNVYISTDYVFDGKKGEPYDEEYAPSPINVYGLSKHAGEVLTANYSSRHYIIRVASLYGRSGKGNIVDSIIKRAREEGAVRVVDDSFMSPMHSKDVSDMLRRFLDLEPPFGVYHLVNEGCCSWFDFARKIFDILGENVRMTPIKSDELGRRAKRPAFSALKNRKLDDLGLDMRSWDDALGDYLVGEAR
jgi:dTDP-4-dehydrorhamnose reductase